MRQVKPKLPLVGVLSRVEPVQLWLHQASAMQYKMATITTETSNDMSEDGNEVGDVN